MRKFPAQLITWTLALSVLLSLPAMAANIYRYYDNQGNLFHGSQVPPEFVKNGYEVLNEKGQVIQTVARALTEEEREAQALAQQSQQQSQEERARQEEEDRLLLRLYRSPEEVIRRRDSTVEQLDAQITALTGLRNDAQRRLDSVQGQVDGNANPPETLLSQLENATEERDRLQRQVERVENEKAETVETAEKNINRLRELLNLN